LKDTNSLTEDKYKKELNPANPLSHGGNVAKSYAALLQEIYSPTSLNSFAPRHFKNTIGKYGPSFSGYGQQDSQEFLLFLLDGLQEDLNRIHKKPYIEKPDSTDEMVQDPVALREMADKCWDIYKARNDSVVTDLFAGMYKSTVVCPVCDKVSIIFDPFNNLTLQLPIESLWSKKIYFFPIHAEPIQVNVDIDKNATFMGLKEYVARKTGTDPKRMVCGEIYKCKFYKTFDDKTSIGEENIQDADSIGIWELEDQPTNFPQPKKPASKYKATSFYNSSPDEEPIPEGETSLDEKMVVAVFHRRGSSSKYLRKEIFAYPTFVVVNREEVKDYDTILQKVLARAATMTQRNFLKEANGHVSDPIDSNAEDSDTVLMGTDEADSSSDSKVQAKSLESEDGMVDISMDSSEVMVPPTKIIPCPKRLPAMLGRGSFISPKVRDLFDMRYLPSNGREMIPAGLSVMDESKNYPSIASRQQSQLRPKPRSSLKDQINHRQQRADSTPSSDEDAEDAPHAAQNQAQDQDTSSDSDGIPPVAELGKPNPGFGTFSKGTPRNSKGLITYSRKGKQPLPRRQRQASSPPPEPEDVPLLKLGESIIVDWTEHGFDVLFGNKDGNEDDLRGTPTWDPVPVLPDPDLEEKRKIRSSRRRNGVTLGDCLDEFGKPEILSENDAWYCPRCKEHRRASKTFELWKAPDILVVHLKRFSAQGRLRDKLDVFVDFPVENLDLSTRLAVQEDGKSPIYDLFAVDNHYGGLGGGHYTAYAKNFYDDQWYEYNGTLSRRSQTPIALFHSNFVKRTGYSLWFHYSYSLLPTTRALFQRLLPILCAVVTLFYVACYITGVANPCLDSSVSRRSDPKVVVTSAAYLLFYRRRTDGTLGGSFFERLLYPSDGDNPESQPTSRAPSPAGEGKRLDGSSRNGSSSALRGVGAAHQAGVGGATNVTVVSTRTGVDDELPAYSTDDPTRNTVNPQELAGDALQSMEMDGDGEIDEGLGDMSTELSYPGQWSPVNYATEQNWSFGNYRRSQVTTIPPNSDVGDEDLFGGDNSSTKVANSSVSDTGEDRMADFGDDVGTTSGVFGTPDPESMPLLDVPPAMEEELEQPVAEVMLEDEGYKMD